MQIQFKSDQCRCGCGTQLIDAKKRQFRQGHDARLKGMLIRAAVEDASVRIVIDGTPRNRTSAKLAALDFGPAFVAAVDKALERQARKANLSKPRPKATPSPESADVGQVKVGRWFYDAKRLGDTVVYTKKDGSQVSANGKVAASFIPA